MPFPAGLTPKTVTIGTGIGFDGKLIPNTSYVVISAPYDVTWRPTGDPIFATAMSEKFEDGVVEFELVPTDLDGLSRVDWTYTATIKIPGRQPIMRSFLLPESGPATVDLESLEDVPSSAGTPVAVNVIVKPEPGTPGQVLSFVDDDTVKWVDPPAGGGGGGGGGVTDHGQLTGLGDDDHPQYLTQTRADVRYPTRTEVNNSLAGKQPAGSYATSQQLSDGLAQKVNTSTYTAGLAQKANTADLAAVAQSGSYTDLANKPFIPDSPDDIGAQPAGSYATPTDVSTASTADRARANHTGTQPATTITGLAAVATSGSYTDLSNTPQVVVSAEIRTIKALTQSAYDALNPKDPATLYVVNG